MKNVTICILLVIAVLMAAGCGKFHTCSCIDSYYYDIIDTALYDSVLSNIDSFDYPVYVYPPSPRESAVECSYWGQQDTLEEYLPEYGVLMHYVFECQEK